MQLFAVNFIPGTRPRRKKVAETILWFVLEAVDTVEIVLLMMGV